MSFATQLRTLLLEKLGDGYVDPQPGSHPMGLRIRRDLGIDHAIDSFMKVVALHEETISELVVTDLNETPHATVLLEWKWLSTFTWEESEEEEEEEKKEFYWVCDPTAGGDSRVFEITPDGLRKAVCHAEFIIARRDEDWVEKAVKVKRSTVGENIEDGVVVWKSEGK